MVTAVWFWKPRHTFYLFVYLLLLYLEYLYDILINVIVNIKKCTFKIGCTKTFGKEALFFLWVLNPEKLLPCRKSNRIEFLAIRQVVRLWASCTAWRLETGPWTWEHPKRRNQNKPVKTIQKNWLFKPGWVYPLERSAFPQGWKFFIERTSREVVIRWSLVYSKVSDKMY